MIKWRVVLLIFHIIVMESSWSWFPCQDYVTLMDGGFIDEIIGWSCVFVKDIVKLLPSSSSSAAALSLTFFHCFLVSLFP
jgi:hypothetical protein